ncbi:MAG TPA: collagenase, partial [Streptomyces sp.]|nr:collagenase [Streptomyces sp.]
MFHKTRLSPPRRRSLRATLLTAAVTAALLGASNVPDAPSAQAGEGIQATQAPAGLADRDGRHPHDGVTHLAKAPAPRTPAVTAPGARRADGRVPGRSTPASPEPAPALAPGCALDDITRLDPERFADFLADPAVTA